LHQQSSDSIQQIFGNSAAADRFVVPGFTPLHQTSTCLNYVHSEVLAMTEDGMTDA